VAYEQKPNTFSLFKDSDERIAERKKFYREKDWDDTAVPTYSGKLVLESGEEVGIEARVVDGAKGKFFAGRLWKKKSDSGNSGRGSVSNQNQTGGRFDDLDDDIPF
jgi:hypothetical protein